MELQYECGSGFLAALVINRIVNRKLCLCLWLSIGIDNTPWGSFAFIIIINNIVSIVVVGRVGERFPARVWSLPLLGLGFRFGVVAENYYSGYYSQSITLPHKFRGRDTYTDKGWGAGKATTIIAWTLRLGGTTPSDVLTATTIYPCIVHNDNYNGNHNYGCQPINNANLTPRFLPFKPASIRRQGQRVSSIYGLCSPAASRKLFRVN